MVERNFILFHFVLFFLFQKLVSKVKDSDVAERSQATNNTRYEDLSSYVLVSTDRAQEVQEGNDITQDTAAANTQDFENVHSKGVPSSACHQKRLQNTPESTVVPPTVTSNKMDRDFSVSDLVPDHFGVNDNSCTSLLNVLHDSAIEQSVQDKHLDSLKDGMCHKDDNLQDNELRPRNLNGGSFVNVADPFRESAHVHAPLNFETRDKMKATGAVPKVPLVENKKLKDKNLIDKSLNDPYTLRAYLISRRQANLSDDRLNIQVDAPALSYDKTASSSEIPVNLNKENGTIVAFEKKSDGQFGQNDTPGEEQKEDKDEIKEEDAPVEEQKEDKEEIKEDSKLENAIRLCAERLLVPTRTDLDREADVTTVQTGGNIDTGKLTGETGLPDVKQLLTSAQLQIVNLQSHKVSAERRNHAPFDNTSRPAQPNRKDKACNQPMKKMSGEEPSSREKPIQHQKPNGRSGSTQGGNTTSKGRQRSRTSSSSSTDTVKNPEYKSTGKKPSEKTVDKKRDVPQRKNRVKSHDVEGKTSKMSKTQRRPMLRENAAKSLPVGNQIANAIEKKTNETDTARCSAEESVFKIERQNCERKRSKEGHDGKTLSSYESITRSYPTEEK